MRDLNSFFEERARLHRIEIECRWFDVGLQCMCDTRESGANKSGLSAWVSVPHLEGISYMDKHRCQGPPAQLITYRAINQHDFNVYTVSNLNALINGVLWRFASSYLNLFDTGKIVLRANEYDFMALLFDVGNFPKSWWVKYRVKIMHMSKFQARTVEKKIIHIFQSTFIWVLILQYIVPYIMATQCSVLSKFGVAIMNNMMMYLQT
jgi:hypothetical protein